MSDTFHFEIEALRASGVAEEEFGRYARHLDGMNDRLLKGIDPAQTSVFKARRIFDYLWHEKPNRYKSHSYYKLSDTIRYQLASDSSEVGNCLGLTVLYNCLLKRMNVVVNALYIEFVFGLGPHVLSLIPKAGICIEHMFRTGFDYKGYTDDSGTFIWGDRELVADIYNSRGTEYFRQGELKQALDCYEKAIALNPQYEKALINRAIVLDTLVAE